jgi:hypothetical protein
MIDDLDRLGFRHLGIKQGRATTLGKFFTAAATAQQADGIAAVYFSDDEIALTTLIKELAFGIDTR